MRANAEQRKDIARALSFYAQGIGLARTEHMFFDVEGQERLIHMQAMILADTTAEREKPLNKLTGFQQSDWENIFRQENGEAVTIRLLDPPLHEFLPKKTDKSYEERIALLMEMTGKTRKQIEDKIKELEEENPMLGHRGNRLLASFPEIARAQLTAAFNAAKAVEKEGIKVNMEIMTALISNLPEFLRAKKQIEDVGAELGYAREKYKIGTMIELVNAALLADKIAPHAEFLSFGTNDLTQTLFGFSREDMGRTVGPTYVEKKFLNNEPFTVLDETTWLLVGIAIQKARKANPKIKIGVCGEHGGDPVSVQRFRQAGVDYVSCSAYRVPVAYLQSAIDAILVKEGKPLPNPPEFKLFAEEEAMPAPREIRLIDGIKYAHSTQKAVVEAVIRVNNKEISKEEAIGSLNLNLIKNYFNSPEGFPVWFVESSEFQKILEWAQEIKTLGIEVLVKNKEEINGLAVSRAEGITVQTEDTFLYNNIEAARRLIFAHTDDTRKKAMLDLASSQYDFLRPYLMRKILKDEKLR